METRALAVGEMLRFRRGGVVVGTSAGAVQFGAPPETLKDALAAGLHVPEIFVLPDVWFRRRPGVTQAEIEFPVYYNYFGHGHDTVAVVDAAGRERLETVLRESFFGPEEIDESRDYDPAVPAAARAQLRREADHFRRKKDGETTVLEDLVTFALYDEQGAAHLGDVTIQRVPGGWEVRDGAAVSVVEAGWLEATPEPEPPALLQPFAPPAFGVTMLGSSHGFDPSGSTTGFVLWVGRQGVLVDPPQLATEMLRVAGVAPRVVDTVILTHCHADHDAGVMSKLLEAGQVKLYTTPTILGSFLRKYAALTGESEARLRRLFVFRPVAVGSTMRIGGADFRFHYTLHSIPTLGFEARYGDRSVFFSGDTLWDPERHAALAAEGVISPTRQEALSRFPTGYTLVLHEAGVPPIHTSAARLAELPGGIKARTRLIHIAEGGVPAGSGLEIAKVGFEHTLVLPVADHPWTEAIEALGALSSIDLLASFSAARCREFLAVARRETHRAGTLLIGQGEPGETFYLILSGEAVVLRDGMVVKVYKDGDFFGETALMTGAPRSADVRARTDLRVLAIGKHDFLALVRGTELPAALLRLARNRDFPSWDLMSENPVLCTLAAVQRTKLQALLDHVEITAGEELWTPERPPPGAWLLEGAEVELVEPGPPLPLARPAFVGDFEAILLRREARSRARVTKSGSAFVLDSAELLGLAADAPGLLLSLSGGLFAV